MEKRGWLHCHSLQPAFPLRVLRILAPPPVRLAPPCLALLSHSSLATLTLSSPHGAFCFNRTSAQLPSSPSAPRCCSPRLPCFPPKPRAQTKNEFNRGLGRLSRQHKGLPSVLRHWSSQQASQGLQAPLCPGSSTLTRAGDLGVVLSSSFCHYLSRALRLLPKPLA